MKRTALIFTALLIATAAQAQTQVNRTTGQVYGYSEAITIDGFEFKYVTVSEWTLEPTKVLRSEDYQAIQGQAKEYLQDKDVYNKVEIRQIKQRDRFRFEARIRAGKIGPPRKA